MRAVTRAACAALIAFPAMARAGTLVFNADTSDAAPKASFEAVIKTFETAHPDITVKYNVYDHESYKSSIRNWLTSAPPDVALWYSGERLRQFTDPGLLLDISDLWTADVKAQFPGKLIDAVTMGGKQYAVPYTYYQWGLYYRQDLFDKAGVAPITRWDDLLSACDKLKAAGIEPIDVGSKDLWPTAGWFDYLDLRLNGYEFHTALTQGHTSWQDPKVKAVFAQWRQLLDKQCFVRNHASLSWQESQSLLYQGKAGMMLIGNFITQSFPPEMVAKMAFTPFPVITAGVADTEEAPTDTIVIPAQAKNVHDARIFVAYLMQPDTQSVINKIQKQLPANTKAAVLDDRFLKAGDTLLTQAAHLTQFLDRDTSEDLATIAMKGFQEFMIKPDRIDAVLANIERARKRIYASQ